MTRVLIEVVQLHCTNCQHAMDPAWEWWTRSQGVYCSVACFLDRLGMAS